MSGVDAAAAGAVAAGSSLVPDAPPVPPAAAVPDLTTQRVIPLRHPGRWIATAANGPA